MEEEWGGQGTHTEKQESMAIEKELKIFMVKKKTLFSQIERKEDLSPLKQYHIRNLLKIHLDLSVWDFHQDMMCLV